MDNLNTNKDNIILHQESSRVKEESYEILGQIQVKINREGQKTDFAECKIYDRELRTDRNIDV